MKRILTLFLILLSVSLVSALDITTPGTYDDYTILSTRVAKRVKERTGINLKPEFDVIPPRRFMGEATLGELMY